MTLISCASYQPNYSDSPDPSHAYNVNHGQAAEFTIIQDIVYTSADWPQSLAAELYLPKKLPAQASNWPVVLMVHGGGWSGRDRSDMDSTAKKLAKQGYVDSSHQRNTLINHVCRCFKLQRFSWPLI